MFCIERNIVQVIIYYWVKYEQEETAVFLTRWIYNIPIMLIMCFLAEKFELM